MELVENQVVWKADDFFLVGGERKEMDPVVVHLPEDKVPLTWNFDNTGFSLGWACNFRLEGREIFCDLEFFLDEDRQNIEDLDEDFVRLGGYYKDIEERREENMTIITSCKLAGVSYVMMSAYPRPQG